MEGGRGIRGNSGKKCVCGGGGGLTKRGIRKQRRRRGVYKKNGRDRGSDREETSRGGENIKKRKNE